MKNLQIITALLVLAACVLLCGGCGYKLSGYSNQLPAQLRTVAIPDFQNKTTRFQADQYITYAVKEEFIKRSNLVLVDRVDRADAVLEGTITSFNVAPITYSEDATANMYRVTITANVRFINKHNNEVIFEGTDIAFSDSYSLETGGPLPDDFFSQETVTLQKIVEQFAASIVTTIMENF